MKSTWLKAHMSDAKRRVTISDITRSKIRVDKRAIAIRKITYVIAHIQRHKCHAIICVVTRCKSHTVIGAIVTHQKRTTKAIIRKMREIMRIFWQKRTLRVQVAFVFVRICSLSFGRQCDLSWKQARKKVTFTLCHSFRLQTCG